MTRGGKNGKRTPALWIHRSKAVVISTTLNGEAAVTKFFRTKLLILNEWSRMEIGQVKKGSSYRFSLTINNHVIWSVENTRPEEFSDIKVFASSDWYAAHPGSIRNFQIENMMPGEN